MPPRARVSKSEIADFARGITHPGKIFWPGEGYTKLDLARFYTSVFPKLQPYVQGHLLTLERCPDGMAGECFYQKEKPKGMPAGTPTKAIRHETGKGITHYVVGGSLETQLALVNLGCIAVHAMASTADAPREPQWMCFDLDPGSGNFSDAAQAGLHIKEALDALRLTSFAKTSGSRGMHVFVPLRKGLDASDVLAFARQFCERVAAAHLRELTVEHSIDARGGRVYLDPFRNAFGQTVVTPFSVRRRPKAPVSTPLDWAEVSPKLDPADFNVGNFAQRLRRSDPWADFFRARQSLAAAAKSLTKL
ncbi:MAG TPA: non-homologous end-joining DNA ligase [Candidatus Acidoferrales bacterium]|nr:non-homologous end-joining DNA ligase [Candidatus Acidoferrales bacterium]